MKNKNKLIKTDACRKQPKITKIWHKLNKCCPKCFTNDARNLDSNRDGMWYCRAEGCGWEGLVEEMFGAEDATNKPIKQNIIRLTEDMI